MTFSMGRFANSFHLVKESFEVLKKDKEIMLFPIISILTFFVLCASLLIPFYPLLKKLAEGDTAVLTYYFYAGLFLFYILTYFVMIFFNTGLVTCANIRLNGGDPTFKDGVKNAAKHVREIFLWALISATVGILLKMASSRSKTPGKIATSLLGMAWNLLTFFIVPVLVFEDLGIIESVKRSGQLFVKTWGENFISKFSMGLFFTLLFLLGFIPIIISFLVMPLLAVPVLVLVILYWVLLGIVSSSLDGIFVTALYSYAKTGKVPSAYSPEVVKHAFTPKTSRVMI